MDLIIKTQQDLRDEIYRLEGLERQQGQELKARFSSPSAIFSSIFSMFGNAPGTEGIKEGGFFKQDFLGLLSRFVLPFTLNKTIFRNSSFLIKTLVGVLSQKASHYISEDTVSGMWAKVKHLFDDQGAKTGGGIAGKIKALFESKQAKKAYNHPANAPVQQNVLKPVL